MSEKEKKPITIQETLQILEIAYQFVGEIPELPVKLLFEEIKDKVPCLSFVQEAGGGKSNFNVIGGYDGELLFNIFFKIDGKDTKSRLGATKLLTYIGAYLEQKTLEKDLPKLPDKTKTLKSIRMIDNPVLIEREENGHHLYGAQFSVVYVYRPF